MIIWDTILGLQWNEEELDILEATLEVLEDINYIDDKIVDNIVKIIKKIPSDWNLENRLCKYLKSNINADNLDLILKIMLEYKVTHYDNSEFIELCEIIKKDYPDEFYEFKDNWIIKNQKFSDVNEYLLKV